MRKYETIFILDPDLEEEQVQPALEKIKGIITQANGEILKVEDWGKRKLAYDSQEETQRPLYPDPLYGNPCLALRIREKFPGHGCSHQVSIRSIGRATSVFSGRPLPIREEARRRRTQPPEQT